LDYKIAILDWFLPGEDGGEVAKVSKEINPSVPIIGLSAIRAKMEGVDLQIKKPNSYKKLKKVLFPALENPEKFLEDLCLYTDIF